MRINKYLAHKGHATRRGADELIEAGLVTINGKRANIGDLVKEADKVEVSSSRPKTAYLYFAYNKPKGVLTHSATKSERDIQRVLKRKDIFPIGRLDKESHGLILLTNDGRLTDRLLNPKCEHEKEYEVELDRPISNFAARKLERGVVIEGYKTKPAKIKRLGEKKLSVTLTEGKKHQVRRMLASLGPAVRDLKRVRIMHLSLKNLREGETRPITGSDLSTLLKALSLSGEN